MAKPAAAAGAPRQTRHEILAGELRGRIMSGELAEGTYLPGEREMVARTGYSRGSVREAIRILEVEGLVRTRVAGRYGGSIVQYAPGEPVRRMLEMFIRTERVRFETLLQARQAIEPTLAFLAALHRTEEDLAAIRAAAEALEAAVAAGHQQVGARNLDWHLAIARASHNELLAAFMTGISGALMEATSIEKHGSDALYDSLVSAHRRIVEAIAARDGEAARRRMTRHLAAYQGKLGDVSPSEVLLNTG